MTILKLSIIIPMYNVEDYVERCIRSIEEQDISAEEYEIICINDGSPDNSRGVVVKLQSEFDNIILVDQKNRGVSNARNNGIDHARGNYLLFIDPDDYVDTYSLGRVLTDANKRKAQVSFLGYTFLYEDGTIRKHVFNENYSSEVYPGTQAYFLSRGDGRTDPDRMVAILFSTEFLNQNDLRFLPNVPYLEDGELIARILCLASRCIFNGYSFYQRTTRPGSATNSKLFFSQKASDGFLIAANNLKTFQITTSLNNNQKIFINQPIVKFVLLTVNSSLNGSFFSKMKSIILKLKECGLNKCVLTGCKNPYILYGRSYNISPYLAAFALYIMPRLKYFKKCLQRKS